MTRPRRFRLIQPWVRGLDTNLLAALFFVIVLGLIMIYSASYYGDSLTEAGSMAHLKSQVRYTCLGIAAMLAVSCVNYHFWRRLWLLGYPVCLALVLLLKTPLGYESHNAVRWLQFGSLQLQVAEPIKLIMIIFMAAMLSRWGRRLRSWTSMLLMLLPSGVMAYLILKISDNLSTAVILMGMTVFMIYVVHPQHWKFFLCAAIVAAAAGFMIWRIWKMDPSAVADANFRIQRIRAWLEPYEYESDTAFQPLQGLYAIGSGGLWGKGLGNSIQKLGKIPEPFNDYIFAIICEELGIFGAGLIILLFLYLLYRIYTVAQTAEDLFGRMLTIGVFAHMSLQISLNLLVVTGLFPTTGVTLPFFSFGGSAAVFSLIEIGLVLNVNKYSVEKRLEDIRRMEEEE